MVKQRKASVNFQMPKKILIKYQNQRRKKNQIIMKVFILKIAIMINQEKNLMI